MELVVHRLEARLVNMGVDLGGGDVGVAKQQLHAAQIGAVLHHVGGATVAKCMGMYAMEPVFPSGIPANLPNCSNG